MTKKLLILIILIFYLVNFSFASEVPCPKGLYAFGMAKNFQDTPVFDFEYIDGFTAYSTWKLHEPQEGKYDWTYLDTLLKMAKKSGKILNIGIYPGHYTPDWLYEKYNVKKFKVTRHFKENIEKKEGKQQEERYSPLPWDRVYLEKWKNFIKAFAEHFREDKSIGYIALTGPTIEGLAMGIPIREKDEVKKFKESGYSPQRMIEVWTDMMDFYSKILPNKKWAIAVAPLIISEKDPWPAYAIVDYGFKKYPNNLVVMGVYLNDTWFNKGKLKINNSLIKKSGEYACIGFQMAQSAYRNSTWEKQNPIVKSLRDSFLNGNNLGILFLEVWHNADIVLPDNNKPNPRYIEDLKYINYTLKNKKIIEFKKYNGEFYKMYIKRSINAR